MSQKPVVVYGASGYTGALVCEDLARRGIAFTCAGRNRQRLDQLAAELGAHDAKTEAVQVAHDLAELTRLFRGSKVVINCTGPFVKLGETVVQAALDAGCHYLDTTGEQPFMLDLRERYGQRYEQLKLVLNPSCAYFWGPGSALAEVCLETQGIDAITVFYSQENLQTVASLQSFVRMARHVGSQLVAGELKPIKPGEMKQVLMPDTLEVVDAVSIATGEPTFLQGNPRVRSTETLIAFKGTKQLVAAMKGYIRLSRLFPSAALDDFTDRVIEKYKRDPPREVPESARFVCAAWGMGNNVSASAVMRGHGPYVITGFFCAEGAQRILEDKVKRFGYVSTAQFVGPRELLSALERAGAKTTIHSPSYGERAAGPHGKSVVASA